MPARVRDLINDDDVEPLLRCFVKKVENNWWELCLWVALELHGEFWRYNVSQDQNAAEHYLVPTSVLVFKAFS